jgi:hypothetical protein
LSGICNFGIKKIGILVIETEFFDATKGLSTQKNHLNSEILKFRVFKNSVYLCGTQTGFWSTSLNVYQNRTKGETAREYRRD